MVKINTPHIKGGSLGLFLWNLFLAYVVYFLCRLEFIFENWGIYKDAFFQQNSFWDLVSGSLTFDTSAILYTNSLYALLMLFPCHLKETAVWQKVAKWVFLVVNSIAVILNLGDSVYFKYTGRRTTISVLQEFHNENNLASIFSTEILNHWYLFLFGVLLIYGMWKFYGVSKFKVQGSKFRYYIIQIAVFLLYIPLTIAGMRGGFTTAVRPITISNANQYVNHPQEAAAILNTPFSIIRTFNKHTFVDPKYYSQQELDKIYSPIHNLKPETLNLKPQKNIVILIVESFGREYIGAYNEKLDGGNYKGYTPFIDKLYSRSMSFDYTFCNGRKSIDAMPSVLSSIPMFVEPFILTPSSMNNVGGIASALGRNGYYSAFFHGAENGSMGFEAFARTTGFKDYFGRTEYNKDKRFNGDKDFDGTWAIWDEPFLQFYALKMTEFKQPFVTALFTATSHHPYQVPDKYKKIYREEGGNPIHKCIRYVDHAFEEFFKTASRQPWYKNTIFVFTSDHTNLTDHDEYKTDLGGFGSPILIFDPSGELFPAGRQHRVAQQIDIMPTLLSRLGYSHPYIAFGKDVLQGPENKTWAINYNNGIYQYVENGFLLQFDGSKAVGLYNLNTDWMLKNNLVGNKDHLSLRNQMERRTKAIIQSYMQRMENNLLIFKE